MPPASVCTGPADRAVATGDDNHRADINRATIAGADTGRRPTGEQERHRRTGIDVSESTESEANRGTASEAAGTGGTPDQTAEVATYEIARDELTAVVAELESGGLSLDESLTLWERGEHLAAVCSRFLDGARERVESALAEADRPD